MAKKVATKKDQKHHQKSDPVVITIISVFAVVIIALIVISFLPKKAVTAAPTPAGNFQLILTKGDKNAPVTVIEIADYQCPYCLKYQQQLEPTIISTYVDTGKVYYALVPLSFLGQESVDAALAGYCANDQGKFWEYRSLLAQNYLGENKGSYTQDKLISFAGTVGLNVDTFTTCLTTKQHQQNLTDADAFATANGVDSTPTFLVNGVKVGSADLQATIDKALGQ
jgi:protein-disulfide isomerase